MYEVNQRTKRCLQQNQVASPAVWFLLHSSHPAKHGKTSAPTQLPLKTTTRDLPYLKPTQPISGFFVFFFFSKHNKTVLQFVPGKWKRAYAKLSLQT